MPYTNTWAETEYPGTTQARDIDDKARLTALAIEERMEDALVVDWRADPVVPKDSLLGKKVGKYLLIGCERFRELNGTLKAVELNPNFLAVFRGSARVMAHVHLPPGTTIKLVELMVNRGDVTNYTWRLISVDFANPPTETVLINDAAVATAGFHIRSSAVQNIAVAENKLYYLDLDTAGAADVNSMFLYGARITYDTPDSTKTY